MAVWRVADTAAALFGVDGFRQYVDTQAETAPRHVATLHPDDHGDDGEDPRVRLRRNPYEVAARVRTDLEARLRVAGCTVEDTRLTHLAHAPEIAQAMLRRQQAEAVIAARRRIVRAAVPMVDLAVAELSPLETVEMTGDARAMVGNVMVVPCGECDVQPVLYAGR